MNIFRTSLVAALTLLLSQGVFASLIIVGKDDVRNQAEFSYDGDTIKIINNSTGVITGFGFYSYVDELDLDEVEGTLDDGSWDLLTGEDAKGLQYAVGTGKTVYGGKVKDGIAKGATGVFEFDLEDGDAFNEIYKVFVRFQETENDEGSDKGYQCLSPDGCKPVSVPEPGTVALLCVGLFGLAASRRILPN